MRPPETHTLTLQKRTVTKSATGAGIKAWDTVQTLAGSLQPKTIIEAVEFNKQTVKADNIFYVSTSKFTSSANEAELKEANQMTLDSRTFQITGIKDYRKETRCPHYEVKLLEVK